VPPLEPAVVVSRPEEHTHGPGVLIEAVGPDGKAVYQRLLACAACRADQLEEAIEAGIQEAWRHLVQHVRPTDEELGP
jgi:cytochrome c5